MNARNPRSTSLLRLLVPLLLLGSVALPMPAAAEPAACLSADPSQWPASSKPYFMIAADTSSSMTTDVGSPSSCGFGSDRLAHLRCAIRNAVQAFSGQVDFGLATFPISQSGCSGSCFTNCTYACLPGDVSCNGCGSGSGTTRRGAFIRVPMLQDSFWTTPPADNTASMVSWADNSCSGDTELFASGQTPLNGMLRDLRNYFATSWTAQDSSVSYTTPLSSNDLAGSGVNGGTGCRSVNIIFITDGDETCDTQADAVNAAAALYATGVTVGGKTFKIRTFMINFAGGTVANTDAIASAGGTGTSYFANSETQMSVALANILAGVVRPESCDNSDNNCNGCTDEGYPHYGDVGQTCCVWSTAPQRSTCLSGYQSSITVANPGGDTTLLPCTTAAQASDPTTWLCYDPGESCDFTDNNANGSVDEGIHRCGNPLHCPQAEVCNSEDDDCDGLVNEDNVCPGGCTPQPEVCDGCDNDCDGVADNGLSSVPCGLPSPANCAGVQACSTPQPVAVGGCTAGGPQACSNSPQAELCDGIDNDCDGAVDDGVAPTDCELEAGLDYGPNSQCRKGSQPCGGSCIGVVGPSAEICDGIDNDCNGSVDDGVANVGQACGLSTAPCTRGVTACVGGAIVCQGGVQPAPEICDGIDNDCNGSIDDPPLADQPASGQAGCWDLPGNCCSHGSLEWCAPPGASCSGNGSITAPCSRGTLACSGASGWTCSGARDPGAEICDGIDNDCNGSIDDAAGLCPSGRSCTDGGCR